MSETQYDAPGGLDIAADDNVAAALVDLATERPDHPSLAHRVDDAFVDVTASEFLTTVRELAAGMISMGIQRGERVAIFMPTRIEFTYLDYAVWFAGASAVTIYETSSPEQVEWIVGDSGASAIICGSNALQARFDQIAERTPACSTVLNLDDDAMGKLRAGADETTLAEVDARLGAITHDDLATLVYTSGTTGRPKGCMVTHGNLIWEVRNVLKREQALIVDGGSTLMFLPLAHILARVVQVASVTQGVKVYYSTGIANLVPEMGMSQPTWVFAVPRVFEKVFNTAQARAGSGLKRKIFDRAADVAVEYSKQSIDGSPSFGIKLQHALFDKLVYSTLRGAFGGKLKMAMSGGAPLGERLSHFFKGAGVLIVEGYGLTETTAAATINAPDDYKLGTVGRPIPGASVKIAEDGEILVKGGMVFAGYWNNPEATAEVLLDDGWFATGDVGELDDGYLRITGRKKDLIITAAGKNVAPAVLEDAIRAHPLVSQAVVVGNERPFVAAMITLDVEEVAKWAESVGAQASAPGELVREMLEDRRDGLRSEVSAAIDDANAHVSRAESVREFRLLPNDFTIDSGELTPTLKVRRKIVIERYSETISDIYGD